MSYKLIYAIPFATIDDIPCVVEIEKEGYSGNSTDLIAAGSPFTVDIEENDFLYVPTRFSTATIRVVGEDYLQNLFSTAYQQYRVIFKKNNIVSWCGFIKPEVYTQDYSSQKFELEIECMSAMSTLEFIDYEQIEENKRFVSIWEILKKCISTANGGYNAVYIPHVYAKSNNDYNTNNNVLEDMRISEQNFFDEDGEPMRLKEVLEEVCKFLNWTCVDWRGELYFIDVDHNGIYRKYNIDMELESEININNILIQDVGFAGNNHTLDILSGYNKVVLRTSNYPVGTIFGDENFNDLEVLSIPPDLKDGDNVAHRIFLYPSKWYMEQYQEVDKYLVVVDLDQYKDSTEVGNLIGPIPMKYCTYKLNGGKPSITDYTYTNVIQIRQRLNSVSSLFSGNEEIMTIKGAVSYYKDGAIAISGSVKAYDGANTMPPWEGGHLYYRNHLVVSLRIGGKYWNGTSWMSDPSTKFELPWETDGIFFVSDFMNIKNTKTLDMPYSGLSGYIIPINEPMYGEVEFKLYGIRFRGNTELMTINPYGIQLKDFKVRYQKSDNSGKEVDNSDRIYENIVNENYINSLDEIEFKISSYNNDGACYSKVVLGNDYLTDNLYSSIEKISVRPEEQFIRRIIKRYGISRIKLTQIIKEEPEIAPISRLSDKYMVNKRFINAGGEIDFKMNSFQCVMIEV